jgi:lysophospholipase L1-like esterase
MLRFKTDAPVIELMGVIPDGNGTVQTLIVDGQRVPPKALSCGRGIGGGYNAGTVRIAFGSRKIRDIWIEAFAYFAYLKLDQGDTLLAIDDTAEPQMTAIGDSYLGVRSANFGNSAAVALSLAARLGIRKTATDAIGGTGYWNSGGGLGNLNDRLPAHASDNSDIYLVMAGLNDYGDLVSSGTVVWPSNEAWEQAVRGYLQGLRMAQPGALIVVCAPFCPIPPNSDASSIVSPTTNPTGMGDFLYKASLFKQATQSLAAPWVFIDVLMGTGWLNSSGATGDVTNLQWFTGGTPAPGTTATYKPGNNNGGGGGGFGGIASIPVLTAGRYTQAPDVTAIGGSGSGLLLWANIDGNGNLTAVNVQCPGSGYTDGGGLPTIVIDSTYELSATTLGQPTLLVGINPNGQYPLPSFAPPGVTAADLNNIYDMLSIDTVHPSPVGAEYLGQRLAQSMYDAVMAL